MGVWSPEVKEEPRGSTNPGLVGSRVGTWRKAKCLSGGELENTARLVADEKAAQELQKRETRLGMQPIAAGDVWQSRMGQDAWRMSRHECKRKTEFGST